MQAVTRFITPENCKAVFMLLYDNSQEWLKQGDLQITIAPKKSKRTIEQNKRLWAIYNELAQNAWVNGRQFTADVWHEYLKGLFIGYNETVLPSGEVLKTPISTTTLNTAEMTAYQDKITAYGASNFGIEWSI